MKAAVYEKGSADVLVLREIKKPVARENEVLVKIYMASVNALDYRSIKMGITKNNTIMGADIAGCVESVGQNVRSLRPGDRVAADVSARALGGFVELVVVPESVLVKMPDTARRHCRWRQKRRCKPCEIGAASQRGKMC